MMQFEHTVTYTNIHDVFIWNGYVPIALSETVSLDANEYVEIMFAADSTSVTVDSVASTAFAPAAPAVVLEVTQVQQ